MDKTNVRVYFSIYSDEPNPLLEKRIAELSGTDYKPKIMDHRELINTDKITRLLDITPTETKTRGEIPEKSITQRPAIQTSWTLDTDYQVSNDVSDQLTLILNAFKSKVAILSTIKQRYNVETVLEIVIMIENKIPPTLHFTAEMLRSINQISEFIDIDIYNMQEYSCTSNRGKSKVRAVFCICSNELFIENNKKKISLDEITKLLDIVPIETKIKEVVSEGKSISEIETSWSLSSGLQESYIAEDQLMLVVNLLKSKVDILDEINQHYCVKMKFKIDIYIEEPTVPGVGLESEALSFISQINASLDVNIHIRT